MVAIDDKLMPDPEAGCRCTQPLVNHLYERMTLDGVVGLYYERFRNYGPMGGRWTSPDPLGYVNGANTYQFANSSPVGLRKEPAMRPQEVCGRNPHRQLHVAPNGGQSRRGMGPSAEDYSRPNRSAPNPPGPYKSIKPSIRGKRFVASWEKGYLPHVVSTR